MNDSAGAGQKPVATELGVLGRIGMRLRGWWAFHYKVGRLGPRMNRLMYGIQRRTIYLVPPTYADLKWIFRQFSRSDVSEMFGYGQRGPIVIPRHLRGGALVIGVVKRVDTRRRTGFVIMYPPTAFNFWEFGYAIPDAQDRNAFDALNATDAMAHYMFEHLQVPMLGWRTREDNQNADAVVRRLGYELSEHLEEHGHKYLIYRLDQAGWARRRAKLDAGERRRPSGLGATFVLLTPPYEPRILPANPTEAAATSVEKD